MEVGERRGVTQVLVAETDAILRALVDATDGRRRVVLELVPEAASLGVLRAFLAELEVAEGREPTRTLSVQHSAHGLVGVLPLVQAAEGMFAGVTPVTLEFTV